MEKNWIKYKCADCGCMVSFEEWYGGVCKDCYVPFAQGLNDDDE